MTPIELLIYEDRNGKSRCRVSWTAADGTKRSWETGPCIDARQAASFAVSYASYKQWSETRISREYSLTCLVEPERDAHEPDSHCDEESDPYA